MKTSGNKNARDIPTPSLSVCLLTCINICSHVTSYMIIATRTQIG